MKRDDIEGLSPLRMEQVEVYRGTADHVVIKQSAFGEDALILLHPAQIPILVQWLQEVAAEIQSAPLNNVGDDAQMQISD